MKHFNKPGQFIAKVLVLISFLIIPSSCGNPPRIPTRSVSPTAQISQNTSSTAPPSANLSSIPSATPHISINTLPVSNTQPAQSFISSYIYDDSLAPGWKEYLWDTLTASYSNRDPVAKGSYSMAITPGRGWTAWHAWADNTFDVSPYQYLTFKAKSDTPNVWWEVQLVDQGSNKINQKAILFSPPTNDWKTYTIDLMEYGAGRTQIFGIRFWYVTNEVQTSTLFLDELGFGGIAPTQQPTPPPQIARLSFAVDANSAVNPFRKEMLGVAHGNWDHAWGRYFPGDVPGLAEIYKAANIGLIRYAGGLWANFVMWERSPQKTPYGEYQANPANFDSAFSSRINTNNVYSFHYGMDEIDSLAKLAASVNAEVLIQVNISKDDPAMWADLVHYANIEKKYGFQYWELGNEIDLECQRGNTGSCISDKTYQNRAESYIRAMKAVDPSITIIGGAAAAGHDIVANNWVDTPDMSRYLAAGFKAGADALSYHWFADCNLKDLKNIFAWKYDEPDTAWQHMYSRYWSALGPTRVQQQLINPSGKSMEFGITELNLDACNMGRAPVNSNHIAALWYADVIGRMAYNGVDFATWYEGYGNGGQGFPAVFVENDYYPIADTIYLRPIYSTIFLYGNFFGNVMLKTSDPDPTTASLYASVDSEDPNKLYLMVTNLSEDVIQAEITISGFSPAKGVKYELKNPNPLSLADESNGIDHGSMINDYKLTSQNIATARNDIPPITVTIQNGIIRETFSRYTVTALILEK